MVEIQIVTWNSQGDPTKNQKKEDFLDGLLSNYDVVLLQEAGALAGESTYRYDRNGVAIVCGFGQSGAYNNRCGSAIISTVNLQSKPQYYTLPSSTGRQGISIEVKGFIVATLHSVSGSGGMFDGTTLIRKVLSNNPDRPIIVGGDWNSDPPGGAIINTGTKLRREDWGVAAPANRTHSSGQTLDWFVFTNCTNLTIHGYAGRYDSDHHPVRGRFWR